MLFHLAGPFNSQIILTLWVLVIDLLVLRSLSAVGRSRHAVELEKRAIHLLLEEGNQIFSALSILTSPIH